MTPSAAASAVTLTYLCALALLALAAGRRR
jgi:hypothetical protein